MTLSLAEFEARCLGNASGEISPTDVVQAMNRVSALGASYGERVLAKAAQWKPEPRTRRTRRVPTKQVGIENSLPNGGNGMSIKIEWADITINPVVGCSKCSPGCDNCYAERFAARLAKNPATAKKYAGVVGDDGKWTGKINGLWMNNIVAIHNMKRPKRIFMGSMSDFFHDGVYDDMLFKMFAYAALCPQHTFLLLTKRPERMSNFMADTSTRANDRRGKQYMAIGNILGCDTCMDGLRWPLPNVWLGVTVCNQAEADEKIPVLLETPAAKRFVSVEPMLGPVDLKDVRFTHSEGFFGDALQWHHLPHCRRDELQDGAAYPALDWVICGGETGPGARPMHPDWVRSLRDQCATAGVPFFFKGWGDWLPREWKYDGATHAVREDSGILHKFAHSPTSQDRSETATEGWQAIAKVGKSRAGRLLDGRAWNEVPETRECHKR